MSDRIPMTPRGKSLLDEELKRLKSTDRPRIVKEIEIARAHGDISENAEYHAAKERQGQIEARIRLLEDRLARAQVIDGRGQGTDRVSFGATVVLSDSALWRRGHLYDRRRGRGRPHAGPDLGRLQSHETEGVTP